MSSRARPAAAALLCLTLAISAMAALGLSCALHLLTANLIDTAEGIAAGIDRQIQISLRQAGSGDDPVKSLHDSVELQRLLTTLLALRSGLVYVQMETANGQALWSAERGANSIPQEASSLDDLRRRSRSPMALALLPALWSPHTFELRRPVLGGGRNLGTIDVGVSTASMVDGVHAQTWLMIWGGGLTIGLAWLAFCLLAGPSTTRDGLRPGAADNLIEAGLRKGRRLHGAAYPAGRSPEPAGRSDSSDATITQNILVELLDSIGDGALTIDGRGMVGFANSKAHLLLGAAAAMPGKTIRDALGSEHPMVQILEAAAAGPARPQHLQINAYGSHNRLATINVSTFPANHERGLVVLLGEPTPIDEMPEGFPNAVQPRGPFYHGALVEITVSEKGIRGIDRGNLRELLDSYFASHDGEASGLALVAQAQELHRAISAERAGAEQMHKDRVLARIRLPVGSAQDIHTTVEPSDPAALVDPGT